MRFFTFVVFMILSIFAATVNARADDEQKAAQAHAEAVLDRYYEAVGRANFNDFIALFSKNAVFYGTDASEIWTYEAFAPSIKKSFSTGIGWNFDLKDRHLSVSQSGDIAWFSELAHFNNTDYLLRPSGVMEKQNGEWKLTQLVMGIPIPNLLYPPVLQGMQASKIGKDIEINKINTVLDNLHTYAAAANSEAYFDLFAADGIFLGTDAAERWTIEQFKAYALPYFSKGQGWVYTPRERHITLSPMSNIAWFDEMLDSKTYGTSRGSGVLIRLSGVWKISQYNLTFPIPNDLAAQMTQKIIAFEQNAKQK